MPIRRNETTCGRPQFTSADFWAPLKSRGISISMHGRGRALDNIFIERLWRPLKYELIYPGDFATGLELFPALENYFHFYNHQRPHPGARLSDAGRFVPAQTQKEKVSFLMGTLSPKPPGIYRFRFPEWMFLPYCKGCL